MYPPYVSLLVLRRFPAFFLPRLPPFLGLPFFVGLAFFGLPAISKCLKHCERHNKRSEMIHAKRGAPPIYTLGVRKKRDRNDHDFRTFESNVSFDPIRPGQEYKLRAGRARSLSIHSFAIKYVYECVVFIEQERWVHELAARPERRVREEVLLGRRAQQRRAQLRRAQPRKEAHRRRESRPRRNLQHTRLTRT